MALLKLQSVVFLLLEDDYNQNVLPLITELLQNEKTVKVFCYEQPASVWRNIFKNKIVEFREEATLQNDQFNVTVKTAVIIDSVNQMAITLGWDKCFRYLKRLQSNPCISKLIVILHKDCLLPSSKLSTHLSHIANAKVSYESSDPCKMKIVIKKTGKVFKSDELLSYDYNTGVLRSNPIVEPQYKEDVPEKVDPGSLSTFKIEVEQTHQLEKNKLKLPYMSKINEGQGKVYYEPDAVDDWDDEDPDDDLDI